ncbi:MAG TPA: IS1595 family transposase [Coriobacteriia bacterium]|jgi:transposase-like protein
MSPLDQPYFHDDTAAREYLEQLRWAEGAICPHCGVIGEATRLQGKKHRPGVWKCNACKQQFTVTVGTVFERSKVPLHKWLLAVYLLCSSKKGISSHQLMRTLGVQYKTAWFMSHRIREAMSDGGLLPKLGGDGETVEADETYWGNKKGVDPLFHGNTSKHQIFSMVERGGNVRSWQVPNTKANTLLPIISDNVERGTRVCTDEANVYKGMNRCVLLPDFSHETVCHKHAEYVRGDVYTNTIEGYFGILKRGLTGVYQHVSEEHLQRYIAEFDFRYNHRKLTDLERTADALRGIQGKRLYYRP